MKVYLLTFNGLRQPILDFLDTRREVKNWFAILTNAILIVSDRPVRELSQLIHAQFPFTWFVMTAVEPSSVDGFISKATWDFINSPKASGRW